MDNSFPSGRVQEAGWITEIFILHFSEKTNRLLLTIWFTEILPKLHRAGEGWQIAKF